MHTALEDEQAMRSAVRRTLSGVFERPLDPARDETDLTESVEYDSVTVLECVDAVEAAFHVGIDAIDDDLRHTFRSVASIATLVDRKLRDLRALGAAPAAPSGEEAR